MIWRHCNVSRLTAAGSLTCFCNAFVERFLIAGKQPVYEYVRGWKDVQLLEFKWPYAIGEKIRVGENTSAVVKR